MSFRTHEARSRSEPESVAHVSLIARIVRKLSHPIYKLFSIDSVTGLVVARRADMKRYGSSYGGWSIPSRLLNAQSICYCVGCGEDITFDLALIETFGCRVFAFDPTPRAVQYVADKAANVDSYIFSDIGLWNDDTELRFFVPKDPAHVSHSALNLQKTERYFEAQVRRLGGIMAANGHEWLDLLKLDIEGAEYAVLNSIIEDKLSIRILCVEYDEFFQPLDGGFKVRIRSSVEALLDAGFIMVSSEGNGNYTFVHKDAV
jgi:FkbM family methyltransferase